MAVARGQGHLEAVAPGCEVGGEGEGGGRD